MSHMSSISSQARASPCIASCHTARVVRLETGSDGDFEEPLTNNRPFHALTTFSYKANVRHESAVGIP